LTDGLLSNEPSHFGMCDLR